jgi:hypothetical protein
MSADIPSRVEAELQRIQAQIREQKRFVRDRAHDREAIAKITQRLRELHTRRTELEHDLAVYEAAKP